MKFTWMLGNSLEAHHLLYAYLAVWLIQGGYASWITWQWVRTKKDARPVVPVDSVTHEES